MARTSMHKDIEDTLQAGAAPAASAPDAPRPKRKRLYSRKNDIVLAAAERVFLRSGFAATSMDDVAKEAQVSKRTVYSNFQNKADLFAQVIQQHCARNVPSEDQVAAALKAAPAEGLLSLAIAFLKSIFHPSQIELYQTVVAAVRRHPDTGRYLYDGPITATQDMFASYLDRLVLSGHLEIEDTSLAAAQLIALLKTNIHMKLMFGRPIRTGPKSIAASAKSSVDLFLKGYAPTAKISDA